jgi:hypothetical protein
MDNQAPEVVTKTAYEERFFEFDWSKRLAATETMSDPTIAVLPTDPTPGVPIVSTTNVQVKLTGGTVNTTYQITCKVNTSTGQKLEGTGILKIVPPGELS